MLFAAVPLRIDFYLDIMKMYYSSHRQPQKGRDRQKDTIAHITSNHAATRRAIKQTYSSMVVYFSRKICYLVQNKWIIFMRPAAVYLQPSLALPL